MDALRRVSVSELVATLRAKARRHGTQTSHYRGVSLLKQTGKWHGQINVGGKQLHLGFFATEELAARAYDRAAIHKASQEGGVVVTNLDIKEYSNEMETLRGATRNELLALIADVKKHESHEGGGSKIPKAGRVGLVSNGAVSGSGSGGATGIVQPTRPTAKRASHEYVSANAGGGFGIGKHNGELPYAQGIRVGFSSGSGSGSEEEARVAPETNGIAAHHQTSGGSSRERTTRRGESPPSEGTIRDPNAESDGAEDDTPTGSAGDRPSGDSDDATTTTMHEGKRQTVKSKKGARQQEESSAAGVKRPAPASPPRVPGKQRRTKQAPRQAPCAA